MPAVSDGVLIVAGFAEVNGTAVNADALDSFVCSGAPSEVSGVHARLGVKGRPAAQQTGVVGIDRLLGQ